MYLVTLLALPEQRSWDARRTKLVERHFIKPSMKVKECRINAIDACDMKTEVVCGSALVATRQNERIAALSLVRYRSRL